MLQPARTKYRKQQKGRTRGLATRGATLAFGEFGLQSLECARLTSQQIEAGRVAVTRHVKRGAKLWVRIFPDKPVTKKPAETRMGKGKGDIAGYVAPIRRELIGDELKKKERDVKEEVFNLEVHLPTLQTANVSRVKKLKKDLARVL